MPLNLNRHKNWITLPFLKKNKLSVVMTAKFCYKIERNEILGTPSELQLFISPINLKALPTLCIKYYTEQMQILLSEPGI